MLEYQRDENRVVVVHAHAHHNQFLVGIDIEHLTADAQGIKAGTGVFRLAHTTQVIPVEVVAVVAGVIVCGFISLKGDDAEGVRRKRDATTSSRACGHLNRLILWLA